MKLLVYGDIGGSGGYIRYCKGIFGSKIIPKDCQVWFICSSSLYEKLKPLDPQIRVITHPWILSNKRFYRYLWHLWVYPRIIKEIKPDIEFYPSGQLRVFLRKALTIATCHNLLLFNSKELDAIYDKKEKRYFQSSRKRQGSSFKKSDGVIFLSNYSQLMVSDKIKSIKRSTVISHGLDRDFLRHNKRAYHLDSKIKLLYISPYYNYKHQIEVIKAVQIIRKQTGLDILLNLIGGGTSSYATQLKKFVENQNIEQFILVKDKVEYKDLLIEYQMADIFIFASSCETFGITILEAMGARLPIACSDRTGLSEILKDAGVYFNPESPESIAVALKSLIDSMEVREILGERAYKYALDYTWKRCALETMDFIKKTERANKIKKYTLKQIVQFNLRCCTIY